MNTEAVVLRCSVKKVFLEILQNSQENTCARDSFLIKLQAWACNFIKKESLAACNFIKKESLAQVFSCEFYEISKNTFFYRTHPVAASVNRMVLSLIIKPEKNFKYHEILKSNHFCYFQRALEKIWVFKNCTLGI